MQRPLTYFGHSVCVYIHIHIYTYTILLSSTVEPSNARIHIYFLMCCIWTSNGTFQCLRGSAVQLNPQMPLTTSWHQICLTIHIHTYTLTCKHIHAHVYTHDIVQQHSKNYDQTCDSNTVEPQTYGDILRVNTYIHTYVHIMIHT